MLEIDEALDMYDQKIANLSGWLHPTTAYASIYLLHHQKNLGHVGNLLEIGVYGGLFLAIMSSFASHQEIAYGIDPFYLDGTSSEKVMDGLHNINCGNRVKLVKARSDDFSKNEYKERFGQVRFMHIDGSHRTNDVMHDLAIADDLLSDHGILLLDDFLNPYWMGVTEAAFIYFERTNDTNLSPFAYCRNKLFLCRRSQNRNLKHTFMNFTTDLSDRITLKSLDRTTDLLGHRIPAIFW